MALKLRADNLKDAMSNFVLAPLEPDELAEFHIERDKSPIHRIKIQLEDTTPQHLLFAGQRGSGKSSELAKLETHLQDEYFVTRYSLVDFFDVFDLQHLDVLVSIPIALAENLVSHDVKLGKTTREALDSLWDFGKSTEKVWEKGKLEGASAELSLGSMLSTFLGLKAQLRSEKSSREQVRTGIYERIKDLLEGIRLIGNEVHTATGKKPIVIVEGTDKADIAKLKTLFYEYGQSLSSVPVSVIYTLPSAFITDINFQQVKSFFDGMYVLPNFKTRLRDDSANEQGLQCMRDILLRRISVDIINKEAVEALVNYSGGVPRYLILLAHSAILFAREAGATTLTDHHVRQAVVEERSFFRPSNEQKKLLAQVKKTKQIDQTEGYWNLLHALSILEYRNDEVWYNLNPVLDDLVPEPAKPRGKKPKP